QADRLGNVVAVVDGVEITGCPGIANQGIARERVARLCDDLTDCERFDELSERGMGAHASSPLTTRVEMAVTTWAPDASTMVDSAVTIALPPSVLTLVTLRVAVSSSPATTGRV